MADKSKVAEADLYYLAGLIDGEGCFQISRKKGKGKVSYNAKLVIGMGGPVVPTLHKRLGIGTVYFKKPQKAGWRGIWVWTLCKNDLWPLLPSLIPLLIGKAEQATAVFEVYESQGFHVGRGCGAEQCEVALNALRDANQKGA
jgi:hypothetical protein